MLPDGGQSAQFRQAGDGPVSIRNAPLSHGRRAWPCPLCLSGCRPQRRRHRVNSGPHPFRRRASDKQSDAPRSGAEGCDSGAVGCLPREVRKPMGGEKTRAAAVSEANIGRREPAGLQPLRAQSRLSDLSRLHTTALPSAEARSRSCALVSVSTRRESHRTELATNPSGGRAWLSPGCGGRGEELPQTEFRLPSASASEAPRACYAPECMQLPTFERRHAAAPGADGHPGAAA